MVDQSGAPVTGRNLDVHAIGDIGNAEPDGGAGIATDIDGTFVIEKLAEMGWQITIRDPATREELGGAHVEVKGGQTTTVRILLAP